jgi:hypothetical protein
MYLDSSLVVCCDWRSNTRLACAKCARVSLVKTEKKEKAPYRYVGRSYVAVGPTVGLIDIPPARFVPPC